MTNLFSKLTYTDGGVEKQAADSKKVQLTKILSIASNIKAIHVKTRSYAKHMALDEAFDDLNESLDSFLECVQGYYKRKLGHQLSLANQEVSFVLPGDDGVFEAIKDLEDQFKKASDGLVGNVSPLVSLQDDVLNCFYQLYYRLDLK
jgi:hypothetical protein